MFKWHPGHNLSDQTLSECLATMESPDAQQNIPWSVQAVENPNHWMYRLLSLPGGSTLERHDPLHALVEQGTHINAEAFVLGLSMGADRKARAWQLHFYIWWVSHITPQPFVFDANAVNAFWLGVKAAHDMGICDIHLAPLEQMKQRTINEVREELGINMQYLRELYTQNPVLQTE